MQITILQNILEANDEKAAEVRNLLLSKKIWLGNLISSPGAGKTTLLEMVIMRLKDKYRIAVIEGDIETDRDAARLKKYNIPVVLINTKESCHLEAVSIAQALQSLDLNNLDIIFVENVGNLVCPAEFDIGEDCKIAVLSLPEGDDKPAKYPLLFQEAKLIILNKMDLSQHVDFNLQSFYTDLRKINPAVPIMEMSGKTSVGLDAWIDWIEKKVGVIRI